MASVVPNYGRLGAGLLVLSVILFAELLGRPLRLPQSHRAVPQVIIPEARMQGALQFGFEMGTGVRTFMPTGLPHALVVGVLMSGEVILGLVAGVGFGVGRAVMTLLRSSSGAPGGWDSALRTNVRRVGQLTAASFTVLLAAATVSLLFG